MEGMTNLVEPIGSLCHGFELERRAEIVRVAQIDIQGRVTWWHSGSGSEPISHETARSARQIELGCLVGLRFCLLVAKNWP